VILNIPVVASNYFPGEQPVSRMVGRDPRREDLTKVKEGCTHCSRGSIALAFMGVSILSGRFRNEGMSVLRAGDV
jgi:hypothetical protein